MLLGMYDSILILRVIARTTVFLMEMSISLIGQPYTSTGRASGQ
jgi:hypothetical protein